MGNLVENHHLYPILNTVLMFILEKLEKALTLEDWRDSSDIQGDVDFVSGRV
jgi:pectin methylesterase-like acyl-CoA thioesterase